MDPFVQTFTTLAEAEPDAAGILGSGAATRGELLESARLGVQRLREAGVRSGDVVALDAPSGARFVAAWLALRMVDACALLVDPGTPVAAREGLQERVPAAWVWRVGLDADWPKPSARDAARPLPGIATVKLTSGSCGAPTGVAVTAEQLATDGRQLASTMGLDSSSRIMATVPMSHSYGFSILPTMLLLRGSSVVVPADEDTFLCARRFDATVLPSVPAWYRAQLRLRGSDFDWPASLRLYMTAGAPLTPELAQQWLAATGHPIRGLYGSSECGGIAYDRTGEAGLAGRVGAPVDGVKIELIGSEGEQFVCVHSAAVASGYVPRDASNRLASGVFETEDLACFEDGDLRLLGRASRWINVRGKKVDPREVEATIAGLAGVEEVAVLPKPLGDERGDALRAVVARSDSELAYRDVAAWCRTHLAAHKVPRSIVLVDELPRNARGKLDREALLTLGSDNS